MTRPLKDKAWAQLGTSGSGNHFVEFGDADRWTDDDLGLEAGTYLALLSHSGSRGTGATVAEPLQQAGHEPAPGAAQASCSTWPGWISTATTARSTGRPWS